MQRITPAGELRFALAQQREDQTLKGLRKSGIRDVALVLVELARRKQRARRNKHLVQTRLPPTICRPPNIPKQGPARECRLRRRDRNAASKHLNFALPPVEFSRDHKAVRRVVFAERELADSVLGLPRMEASLQIMLDAGRRLIAFLRRFREQPHDDHGHIGGIFFAARTEPPAVWQCGSAPIPSDR